MRTTGSSELREMVRLALPVVLVQVGMMTMGVVDTLMVGRLSASALAAVALGNLYFVNASILGSGTLLAMDPVIAQAVGAGDDAAVHRGIQRGLVLAVLLAAFTSLLMIPARAVFVLSHQSAEVVPQATGYVQVSIIGVLPFLVFVVLRQTLQALGRVRPIVWAAVVANGVNAALNWVFIYGHLGAPKLGAVGSAISTVIGRWLMVGLLLALAWAPLRPRIFPLRRDTLDARALRRLLVIGLPIGAQQLLEIAAFGAVGLLMGSLGTAEVAAHQVAITLAALTFMVPVGVSAAAAVRVGRAVGAGNAEGARAAARAAFVCGMGFMTATALVFIAAPRLLAGAFTDDASVIAVAAALLPVAGAFQIFDGAQAVGAGVLRGLGDTRAPLVAMIAGYWVIGVPLGVFLGFHTSLRATGLWWGLAASLAAVAGFLALRLRVLFGRELRRLRVEPHQAIGRSGDRGGS